MVVVWLEYGRTIVMSKRYFGKSNSWLYHKLDGIDGNKKPIKFTEKVKLKFEL